MQYVSEILLELAKMGDRDAAIRGFQTRFGCTLSQAEAVIDLFTTPRCRNLKALEALLEEVLSDPAKLQAFRQALCARGA